MSPLRRISHAIQNNPFNRLSSHGVSGHGFLSSFHQWHRSPTIAKGISCHGVQKALVISAFGVYTDAFLSVQQFFVAMCYYSPRSGRPNKQ